MSSKQELRRHLRDQRHAFALHADSSQLLALFLRSIPLGHITRGVAGYCPMRDEIDPLPIMRYLHDHAVPLALPIVRHSDHPMVFGHYTPDSPLVRGVHGTMEPTHGTADLIPDIVLVPMLGFDRHGHRLGQGGGAYDRTLAALRQHSSVTAVGLAWSCQEVALLPTEPHDIRMDWVVTERDTIYAGQQS